VVDLTLVSILSGGIIGGEEMFEIELKNATKPAIHDAPFTNVSLSQGEEALEFAKNPLVRSTIE